MHPPDLPGTPDFWFSAQRIAVFVDGDFWHGNPNCFRSPKTRTAYWNQKIEANRARDRRVDAQIKDMGINVIRLWESGIKSAHQLAEVTQAFAEEVKRVRCHPSSRSGTEAGRHRRGGAGAISETESGRWRAASA